MQPNTLESRVSALKLIARDTLRMNLISPRLSRITNLEDNKKALLDCNAKHNHGILVLNYESTKLDALHPDYKLMLEDKEKEIAALKELTLEHLKEIEEIDKLIAAQRESIAKIENGETLVSLEELNLLTERLTKEAALKLV